MAEPEQEPELAGAGQEAAKDAVIPNPDPKPRTTRKAGAATRRRTTKKTTAKKATTTRAKAVPKTITGAGDRAPSADQLRAQRANAIAELLAIPAIPATMVGNAVLTYHFTNVGPITAMRLAELAEQSPEIASVIDKATQGNVAMGLVMAAAGYIAPVLLYFVKGPELSHAATQGVEMMNMAPGTLAAMIGSMREVEGDEHEAAAAQEHGSAEGPGQPV